MAELRLARFTVAQRLFHLGLILTFMTQSVTGIGWMFIETPFGKLLVAPFGGYQGALAVHKITGLAMLAGLAGHVAYLLFRIDWQRFPRSLLGPETLVFQWRDVKGFFHHFFWILGLAKAPPFDRWSWWEKFDYWAVWWGLMIVGVTGFILYDPVLSADYVPGWFVNIALWIHRLEAVLAMGHIFTVHFFVEHFRPHNFPFGPQMFEGSMDLHRAHSEHPDWVKRLERDGQLQQRLVPPLPLPVRISYLLFGYGMILLGLFLLVFGLAYVAQVV